MPSKRDTLDIYQDKRGEWRWRRKSPDGHVVGASCEGYRDKGDCEKNAKRPKTAKDTWDFYQDKAAKWRWRRKASNGKVVGAAASGFASKDEAHENAGRNGYAG